MTKKIMQLMCPILLGLLLSFNLGVGVAQTEPTPQQYLNYAKAEFKVGRVEEGLAILIKGYEKFPQDQKLIKRLAAAYRQTGDNAKAQQYLDKLNPATVTGRTKVLEETVAAHLVQEKADYKKAVESSSSVVMQSFLDTYPKSTLLEDGRENLAAFVMAEAFEGARTIHSYEGYQAFLQRYPTSSFTNKALLLGEDSVWQQVERAESVAEYLKYERLFPSGRYLEMRASYIETLFYTRAVKSRSKQAYLNYLNRYPATVNSKEINKDFETMLWHLANNSMNRSKLESVLKYYPNSHNKQMVLTQLSYIQGADQLDRYLTRLHPCAGLNELEDLSAKIPSYEGHDVAGLASDIKTIQRGFCSLSSTPEQRRLAGDVAHLYKPLGIKVIKYQQRCEKSFWNELAIEVRDNGVGDDFKTKKFYSYYGELLLSETKRTGVRIGTVVVNNSDNLELSFTLSIYGKTVHINDNPAHEYPAKSFSTTEYISNLKPGESRKIVVTVDTHVSPKAKDLAGVFTSLMAMNENYYYRAPIDEETLQRVVVDGREVALK